MSPATQPAFRRQLAWLRHRQYGHCYISGCGIANLGRTKRLVCCRKLRIIYNAAHGDDEIRTVTHTINSSAVRKLCAASSPRSVQSANLSLGGGFVLPSVGRVSIVRAWFGPVGLGSLLVLGRVTGLWFQAGGAGRPATRQRTVHAARRPDAGEA
jgi:hypothetical protein